MAHIICISSHKGGTGKTTTAVNLAASLAVLEKKTLLVDCDPLGNATTTLGIDKRNLTLDLYQALVDDVPHRVAVAGSQLQHLDVLPARFRLIHVESKLSLKPDKETVLRTLLYGYRKAYDYIILDSPASLGFLAISALVSADWVVIPFQFQIYALEGLSQLLVVVRDIRRRLNADLKVAGILLTMCDEAPSPLKHSRSDSIRQIEQKLFSTVIPRDPLLRDSANFSKPLVLHDINSKGARAHLELAKEIMMNLKLEEASVDKNKNLNG